MADNLLQQRHNLYYDLSSRIALLDNAQLHVLFNSGEKQSSYGKNHTITLGHSNVFVKRIPVTDLEYENMYSTRNVYDLPTFYNYGFGSAGMGVFRELATHVKSTNWVLSGSIANFPLMYHSRLIPFSGEHAEIDMAYHARYVEYWGSNENIGQYILDRASARYELVLFLEYFPHTVSDWLQADLKRLPSVLAECHAALSFLHDKGILHLDTHFNNMVTEGKHVYLTDFGLALDRQFDLSPAEKQFYRQNSLYDFGYLLCMLGSPMFRIYAGLSDVDKARILDKYGIQPGLSSDEIVSRLLDNIEDLATGNIKGVDKRYAALLEKYRGVSALMLDFYTDMRGNNAKDTRFRHVKLQRLLKEAGFLPGAAPIADTTALAMT